MSKQNNKTKLRTASDVLSRLRWDKTSCSSGCDGTSQTLQFMVGYVDRMNGPMEKPVEDFRSIASGGDVPEHRIVYFRRVSQNDPTSFGDIIWDRDGRVDRIFGSGNGPDAEVAKTTTLMVWEAIATMSRLEIEKEERRSLKAKIRARRAKKRIGNVSPTRVFPGSVLPFQEEAQDIHDKGRFLWSPAPWFFYSSNEKEWKKGRTTKDEEEVNPAPTSQQLSVLTWNVLFDLFDDGSDSEKSGAESSLEARWSVLIDSLCDKSADIIALEEATPRFAGCLLQHPTIQARYACSVSPSETETIDPCGNIILWRRGTVQCCDEGHGLFQCQDYGRNRSLAAALSLNGSKSVFLVAAVHLPSDSYGDKPNPGTAGQTRKESRSIARRRELSSIVGQLQQMEKKIFSSRARSVGGVWPLIMGDFNSDEKELNDGCFDSGMSGEGHFRDVWSIVGNGPGYTFDPQTNQRAARSRALVGGDETAKRIDRIYIGHQKMSKASQQQETLIPVGASLVGMASRDAISPSDHYGVFAIFDVDAQSVSVAHKRAFLYQRISPSINAWAANALPSKDSLLALVLRDPLLENLKKEHDPDSSLVLPHISILYGFAELIGTGAKDLAVEAVRNAVECSLDHVSPSPISINFTPESISVFEHRSSVTLVARPMQEDSGGRWLTSLYSSLRDRFCLCTDQQSIDSDGWHPHVALGKFGSSSAARSAAAAWMAKGIWKTGVHSVEVQNLDILQRCSDGKFKSVSSVPLLRRLDRKRRNVRRFVGDAGSELSESFGRKVDVISSVVACACREVAKDFEGIGVQIELSGSSRLGSSIPMLSDCDIVVKLHSATAEGACSHGSFAPDALVQAARNGSFLNSVSSMICRMYPSALSRVRVAGERQLSVLTTKMAPQLPAVDIMLCLVDPNGQPLDEESGIALSAVEDSDFVLNQISATASGAEIESDFLLDVFRGALRLVKLFAYQRDVYGSELGFLGGGGWAVWLAGHLVCAVQKGVLRSAIIAGKDAPLVSRAIVKSFLVDSAAWAWSEPLSLPGSLSANHPTSEAKHQAPMSVLAPRSHGDFGRNSTTSTQAATSKELRNAAAQLLKVKGSENDLSNALESLLTPRHVRDFTAGFPHCCVVELFVQESPTTRPPRACLGDAALPLPAELKGWGSTRVLKLVVAIEKSLQNVGLRPRSKPVSMGNEWSAFTEIRENGSKVCFGWAWIIGMDDVSTRSRRIVLEEEAALVSDLAHTFPSACSCHTFHCGVHLLESSAVLGCIA